MSSPFLGEIRIWSCSFAPRGWAQCNGQVLLINQNQALFAVLNTQFGGNGTTTFALPDLRSRVPMHRDPANYPIGKSGGVESVALATNQIPLHSHMVMAGAGPGNTVNVATGNYYAAVGVKSGTTPVPPVTEQVYYSTNATPAVTLAATTVGSTGGGAAHENRQPVLALNFCIALSGLFPSRQ
jgi:microcystin-dependent protein